MTKEYINEVYNFLFYTDGEWKHEGPTQYYWGDFDSLQGLYESQERYAMKPYLHGRIHAKKYGGVPEDYMDIDDFIDSSKSSVPDIRHRAILHSSFGCFIVEKVFGATRVNSEGRTYSPRDVAEDHITQDLGFIPTMEQYLNNMQIQPWMSGTEKRNTAKVKQILID